MAPCDAYLFGTLKRHLRNRHFETEDDLKHAIREVSEAIELRPFDNEEG
jgi:hypothetical protein